MPESNENTLVILFGVFTLVATLASLHYRDSLCCLFCRSLINAWSRSMFPSSLPTYSTRLTGLKILTSMWKRWPVCNTVAVELYAPMMKLSLNSSHARPSQCTSTLMTRTRIPQEATRAFRRTLELTRRCKGDDIRSRPCSYLRSREPPPLSVQTGTIRHMLETRRDWDRWL
jgi:hypothetical protein